MREILFRGKRTDTGKWIYGQLARYNLRFDVANMVDEHEMLVPVLTKTIGQFTGLTDKNDKKIFEGDVVKRVGDKCVVKWTEEDAKFIIIGSMTKLDFSFCFAEHLEVIGNIHDNPELLENP